MEKPKTEMVLITLMLMLISGIISVCSITWKNTLGLADANADRRIYQQSSSYIDGKNQLIAKLKYDYYRSTDLGTKQSIIAYLKQEAATINLDKLTIDNRNFVKSLNSPNLQ
jgi:hypothetical protein